VTPQEIDDIIERASKLRIPLRDPEKSVKEWVDELIDYLPQTAVARGDLLQAREAVELGANLLDDTWANIEGWQAVAGHKPTRDQVEDAKRTINPDTWAGRREARRVLGLIDRQVGRLGGLSDDEVVSRLYSLLSGS
jgi:hypothetical protein